MTVHFKILGHTAVRRAGVFTGEWGKPKERAVLAVLLLNLGKTVSIRNLAEWVWVDDKTPQDPAATLHTYTNRIRMALKPLGLPGLLTTEPGGYRFVAEPDTVDYHVFQRVLHDARRLVAAGDHGGAAALLEPVLADWQRPFADLETPHARNWRQVIERDEWFDAFVLLLDCRLRLGEPAEVLRLTRAVQAEHADDVGLARRRITALFTLDREEEATRYYLDLHLRVGAAGDPARAEELRRVYGELLRGVDERAAAGVVALPRTLPADVDGFAGHTDLLAELDALLVGRPRVVTLDGLPGVGKTGLAVHWAHRVRSRFPHGVWYADLNGFGDGPATPPDQVVTDLLEALGEPVDRLRTPQARRSRLRDLLSARQVLLVLDNAADAAHVEPLLSLVGGAVVVVTSRERLSELTLRHRARCFTVPPLGPDLAARWLRDRLGDRAAAEPEALDGLTALAAGLPLALAIIGEYVGAQPGKPLRDFVTRLRESRAVLGLSVDGSTTHLTLRAVFDCSYRVLAADVRRVFRLLGLYPGLVVRRGVAAALTGWPEEQVGVLLDRLVWARLLESREGDRYAFHDRVREYAAWRAEVDEPEEGRGRALRRMFDWYLHTVHNADRRVYPHREAVPLLDLVPGVAPRDFDTPESAMDWCVGERAEIGAVIRLAEETGFDDHLWRLVNSLEVLNRLRFRTEVVSGLRIAVAAARRAGDRFGEAGSLSNLGFVLSGFGEHDEADACDRRAHDIAVEIGDRVGVAIALRNMAGRRAANGRTAHALEMFAEALTIAREEQDLDTEAGIVHRTGVALRLAGRLDDAISQFHLACSLRERSNDMAGAGQSFAALAEVYRERGDHFGALSFAHRALLELRRARDSGGEARASIVLAVINRDLDDLERAAYYAANAVDLAEQADVPVSQAEAHDLLAHVEWAGGDHEAARANWRSALRIYTELGDSRASGILAQLAEWQTPEVPPGRHPKETNNSSTIRGN
ncbi:tetratricopeptide repeat protein [Actinosynnema sp. NPDC020468]|uniref:ATP-binding protein n=1 Tax=Actinosynnema sp. NPDC020468 TaxID=3154488 RepID=UPI0033F4EB20